MSLFMSSVLSSSEVKNRSFSFIENPSFLAQSIGLSALSTDSTVSLKRLESHRISFVPSLDELKAMFCFALEESQMEGIQDILKLIPSDSRDEKDSLLEIAKQRGYPSFEQVFRLESKKISQETLEFFLYQAISNGYLFFVKFLFSGNRKISNFIFSKALWLAALKDRLEIVEYLLERRSVSEKTLGKALYYAILKGNKSVEAFFLEEKKVPAAVLGWAVLSAAVQGHGVVIDFFLSKGIKISEKELGRAWHHGILMGHEAINKLFLEEKRISAAVLGWAVLSAAANGHVPIIESLLSEGRTVSEKTLGKALHYAILTESESVQKFFLEEKKVPAAVLGWAVMSAAASGHEAIMKFLRSINKINSEKEAESIEAVTVPCKRVRPAD